MSDRKTVWLQATDVKILVVIGSCFSIYSGYFQTDTVLVLNLGAFWQPALIHTTLSGTKVDIGHFTEFDLAFGKPSLLDFFASSAKFLFSMCCYQVSFETQLKPKHLVSSADHCAYSRFTVTWWATFDPQASSLTHVIDFIKSQSKAFWVPLGHTKWLGGLH